MTQKGALLTPVAQISIAFLHRSLRGVPDFQKSTKWKSPVKHWGQCRENF